MKKIKDKLKVLKLLDNAKWCLFKQLFDASSLQFSSIIIHQLLLRKIKSKSQNELQFQIVEKYLRFWSGEFPLITGLNISKPLDNDMPHSIRPVKTYLNDNILVRSQELEDAFGGFTNKKDAWKSRLVYFVDGMLYPHESCSKVEMDLISLVESEENFF